MAMITFTLSHTALHVVNHTLKLLHLLAMVTIITLAVKMVYILQFSSTFFKMLPFDGFILPTSVAIICCLSFPMHVTGMILINKVRNDATLRSLKLLFYHAVFSCLNAITIVFSSVSLCIFHVITFSSESIPKSIKEAMKVYSKDLATKVEIDTMQMSLRCCGSMSYKDWFYIPWFSLNDDKTIEDSEHMQFLRDDVPFSCCSSEVNLPCVHHGVLSASHIYRYDPQKSLTLWTSGCFPALDAAATSMLITIVLLLICTSVIQAASGIGERVLQTATTSYLEGPRQRYTAWILGSAPVEEYESDDEFPEESEYIQSE